MLISCLKNYIGAKNIQDDPTSGRFVNDLAGITTDRIDTTYDQDDEYNVSDAWQVIERNAINEFYHLINKWAKRFYLNYSYKQNVIAGQYQAPKTTVALSNEYVGMTFEGGLSAYKNLNYVVSSAQLWSESAVLAATIRAFNLATGEQLKEKTVSLTEGNNRIQLNWSFPLWRDEDIFVCYDASEVTTIKRSDFDFEPITGLKFQKVGTSTDVLRANMSSSGNDNGLILTFNLDCSIDNFVCHRLPLFEEPFLYLVGAEVLTQSIHSEEINRYTLLDYENAIARRDELKTMGIEQLEALLQGLTMEEDPYCFTCNRAVNFRNLLP